MQQFFKKYRDSAILAYKNITNVRFLVLGVACGLFSGIAAVLFFTGVEYFKHLFLSQWAGLDLPAPAGEMLFHGEHGAVHRSWLLPVMLGGVGLITGWLVTRFIPQTINAGTDGTDAMIHAFHRQEGVIKPLVPLIKGGTAVLTIAAGGSAGREGPISQVGAGIGSWLASKLKLSPKERRVLLLAGAAGGLGAIFRAPLGGALTAIEVIYREDFEAEAVVPSVLSSVVSYSLFTLFFGTDPILGIPNFQFDNAWELPFYITLALFCAFTGRIFITSFQFIKHKVYNRIAGRIGVMWTMGLGGAGMGCLGMVFPELLSGGYGWLEMAINGELTITFMAAIIIGKIIATSMTIGSGLSGGMFAPALFIGGMSGGVVGFAANHFHPTIVAQPGGYVLVGMAAFFAGVANAPIGPLVMVCELTQGYGLLAPLMLASAVCLVVNHRFSLYEHQVDNKFDSPAHIEDATINILENLQVKDHYNPERVAVIEEGTTLYALQDIIAHTAQFAFPMRNKDGEFSGLLRVDDVRRYLFDTCMLDLLVAREVAKPFVKLHPEDDLYTALLKFVDTDYGQIPVVDAKDPAEILGIINREDVFQAYHRAIDSLKNGAETAEETA